MKRAIEQARAAQRTSKPLASQHAGCLAAIARSRKRLAEHLTAAKAAKAAYKEELDKFKQFQK
eukprot:9500402-Lingulodinium_polyedra.AAC.1